MLFWREVRLAGQVGAMFERLMSETTIKVGKEGRQGVSAERQKQCMDIALYR